MQEKCNIYKFLLTIYIVLFFFKYLLDQHREGYNWDVKIYLQILSIGIFLIFFKRSVIFLFLTGCYILLCYFGFFTFSLLSTNHYFFINSFEIPIGNFKNHFAFVLFALTIFKCHKLQNLSLNTDDEIIN